MKKYLIPMIAAGSFALVSCDVDQTEELRLPDVNVDAEEGRLPDIDVTVKDKGKLPSVDVDAEGGQLPKFDVDVADVDVKMKEKTITVPVPDVDVKMPREDDPSDEPLAPTEAQEKAQETDQ